MIKLELTGNCYTTAMGILPHTDPEEALRLSLSLDIPFWPQLPRLDFYEDMYVQASENFPGMSADPVARRVNFSLDAFYQDLEQYVAHAEDPSWFRPSERYARVYKLFLERDLAHYVAIRGQTVGPVSFGLKLFDEKKVPIIYHDEVRQVIFDFMAHRIQAQLADLQQANSNAFVWVDEPGLELIFMAFTGYSSERARADYQDFLGQLPAPRGVHLCGNPDWSFLLGLEGLDILSADILQWGHIFTRYHEEVIAFLTRGGIISWGLIPTLKEEAVVYDADHLVAHLTELWDYLAGHGLNREQIARQAWLAPARCCLINDDGGYTVAQAFRVLQEVSWRLRETFHLD